MMEWVNGEHAESAHGRILVCQLVLAVLSLLNPVGAPRDTQYEEGGSPRGGASGGGSSQM